MNMHTRPPESPQDALYIPTDIAPETVFQAIGRLRQEAQDEIDRLLSFLDALDGDADLEPSLSFTEAHPARMTESHPGTTDDREDDADLESTGRDDDEDGHDDEPSLGSSIDFGSGTSYRNTAPSMYGDDLEDEHDGSEPSLSGVTVETTYNDRDLEGDGWCDYEAEHEF